MRDYGTVRYMTGDDPEQSARARSVLDARDVFASTTVLLETEWVLRNAYGFSGMEVTATLRAFAGLPGVSVENPALLAEALGRAESGMDFTDALHLGAAARCEAMSTFDRRFINTAKDMPVRVTEPRDPFQPLRCIIDTRYAGRSAAARRGQAMAIARPPAQRR